MQLSKTIELDKKLTAYCDIKYVHCQSKTGATILLPVTLSNADQFQKSFIDRLSSKFAIKSLLNLPSHRKHVATLLCEIMTFKYCHAREMSEAICHTILSHSKQLLKKFLHRVK